jgi:thiosulfate/3-mercaptopyruvate sulfurtransferase
MHTPAGIYSPSRLTIFFACVTLGLIAAFCSAPQAIARQNPPSEKAAKQDPWAPSQVMEASDFARELAGAKDGDRPTVVYVGFRTLFEGGHIPGAVYHGTASTEQGLAEMKTWAASLPRSTNLVIYCGCCPFDRCPNIRPAFTALHDLGFTKLRVLVLPKSFAADWVDKGFPMEKGGL